jgi:hypothetical protein
MGFRYALGATPAVESASLCPKLPNFMKGAPIEVARPNLEPLTLLWFSFTEFFLVFSGFFHQIAFSKCYLQFNSY